MPYTITMEFMQMKRKLNEEELITADLNNEPVWKVKPIWDAPASDDNRTYMSLYHEIFDILDNETSLESSSFKQSRFSRCFNFKFEDVDPNNIGVYLASVYDWVEEKTEQYIITKDFCMKYEIAAKVEVIRKKDDTELVEDVIYDFYAPDGTTKHIECNPSIDSMKKVQHLDEFLHDWISKAAKKVVQQMT